MMMRAVAAALIVLLATASSASSAASTSTAAPAHNKNKGGGGCASGCTLSPSLVCGANGVTYMGDCLARCSGTTIAYRSACQPPSTDAEAQALAAGPNAKPSDLPPVDVAENPFAADFVLTLKKYPRASSADIKRYLKEGLVLAGYARVGVVSSSSSSAAASTPSGDVEVDYTERERLTTDASGSVGARTMLLSERGLVYVASQSFSQPPASSDWYDQPSNVQIFSASAPPEHDWDLTYGGRRLMSGGNETAAEDGGGGRRLLQEAGYGFVREKWDQVTDRARPMGGDINPLRAVGQVIATIGSSRVYCSGVLVSPKHILTSTACFRGTYNTGTEYAASTIQFIPNKVSGSGDLRGPYGPAVRSQPCRFHRSYRSLSPDQIAAGDKARWAQHAVGVCDFRDPVINTAEAERTGAAILYGNQGTTVYMHTNPIDPKYIIESELPARGEYHSIAGIQRIYNRYSPSENHFLVCAKPALTNGLYTQTPTDYRACKAPATTLGIVPERPYSSIGLSESIPEATGPTWGRCCIRATNGMDGSVLFRIKPPEMNLFPAKAFVSGILVHRGDAVTNPVKNNVGDTYAAMHGETGVWINQILNRPFDTAL